MREFWAQPRTTELKSSGFILLLSILSDFCPFIESKIIQAYLSYNGYTLGQYIFVNVNRIYSCEILDMPCVMSGHVSCSVTSSNLSYPGMLCHVSCVMCHMSYVMCHVPCAMSHMSSVMRHASCIMYHILHVMLCHVSCQVMCHVISCVRLCNFSCHVMCHVMSCVMSYGSCVMHHVSCIICHMLPHVSY